MNFKAHQSQLSHLSARFNLMVCLVFGLLLSNVLLSCLIWRLWHHKSVEITPFAGSPSYFKSDTTVDSHYLSLMSENFINERLNASPETIDGNHKRLLSFVESRSYPELLKQLDREAQIIKTKKMSSTFDITRIRANPTQLTTEVSGVLKRYVGYQALKEERLTYVLTFSYVDSRLLILKFSLKKENADA